MSEPSRAQLSRFVKSLRVPPIYGSRINVFVLLILRTRVRHSKYEAGS